MRKLRILFVIDQIGFAENFSIPIMSSLAKRDGHEVKLIQFSPNPKDACRKAKLYKPDIIAYSICSNESARYLKINQILKKNLDFVALFGGPHPTFFPGFIKEEGVDVICRGEADLSFPALLNNFGNEEMYGTNNFSFKKENGEIVENPLANLVVDLDELPFPDRGILYSEGYFLAKSPVKTFMAGRGCPFNCAYCFNHTFNDMYKGKGKIMRTKSVSYFLEEIKSVKKKYPLTFIKFHDDLFGVSREWLEEFAERYPKEVGLPFECLSRANIITEDYCRLLKKSRCYSLCLGIEAGNSRIRNEILNRNMSDEQIIAACKNLKKFGIHIYALNMVGLPSETYEDIFSTIELNQKVKVDLADASIFQSYPGTHLSEYCRKNGYLDEGAERFESQFSISLLNFDEEYKDKIFIIHRLFAILVDHPRLKSILPFLFKIRKFPFVKSMLNYTYRFYYGYAIHKRIFASKIPLGIRIRGALMIVFSKNRS